MKAFLFITPSFTSFTCFVFQGWISLAKLKWCGGFIKRVHVRMLKTVYNLFQSWLQNRIQLFSSPWAIYWCATANKKVIRTQSEPNPSHFFERSFGEKVLSNCTYPYTFLGLAPCMGLSVPIVPIPFGL